MNCLDNNTSTRRLIRISNQSMKYNMTFPFFLFPAAALYLNFRSVNVTVKVLDILGFSKIFALGLIIITGIVMMARGKYYTSNMS